jgi:hypothetical protein
VVGRLVGIARVVEIELDVADIGVVFVQHGRIDELVQHDGPRQVRGVVDHGIGRRQPGELTAAVPS